MSILLKNRVWVSVHKGFLNFRDDFFEKECLAQFAFGFGCPDSRSIWGENGVSLCVLSRS